jgi:putative endonuclease
MFYFVYVLENYYDQGWYIGFTTNLRKRILDHNNSKGGKTTKAKKNWKIIYLEAYRNKKDAIGREKFLKSGSGRKYLKKQLRNYLSSENI